MSALATNGEVEAVATFIAHNLSLINDLQAFEMECWSLLHFLSRAGRENETLSVLSATEEILSDRVYNAVIDGPSRVGDFDRALEIVQE